MAGSKPLRIWAHPHTPVPAGRSFTHRRTQPLGGIPESWRGPLKRRGHGRRKDSCGYRDARPGACLPSARAIGRRAGPAPWARPVKPRPLGGSSASAAPAPRAPGTLPRGRPSGVRLLRVWATAPTAPITLVQTSARCAGRTPLRARRRREEPSLKGACGGRGRRPAGTLNISTISTSSAKWTLAGSSRIRLLCEFNELTGDENNAETFIVIVCMQYYIKYA
ncbi:uncharacterized protein LOC131422897 [Diceros bicornis minor]|uniref:uncharacterized protein LOC131422897 n=1 Tax=Diceros bicornis minor TaxID=77932 RepID=UPI0026ED3A72|nr:uncharacterized protein LOC131422897 [Diceros bicornis minor]